VKNEQWSNFAYGILAGAVIGGVVALLFAPKSGKETRELIRDKSGDVFETVKRKVGDVRQTVGTKITGGDSSPEPK
jgi:gas vesicle protein